MFSGANKGFQPEGGRYFNVQKNQKGVKDVKTLKLL